MINPADDRDSLSLALVTTEDRAHIEAVVDDTITESVAGDGPAYLAAAASSFDERGHTLPVIDGLAAFQIAAALRTGARPERPVH